MNKKVVKERFIEINEINLPDIGLGCMRTSGTYIAALLQLESQDLRLEILVDVAKKLGFTLDEIADYSCRQ